MAILPSSLPISIPSSMPFSLASFIEYSRIALSSRLAFSIILETKVVQGSIGFFQL